MKKLLLKIILWILIIVPIAVIYMTNAWWAWCVFAGFFSMMIFQLALWLKEKDKI